MSFRLPTHPACKMQSKEINPIMNHQGKAPVVISAQEWEERFTQLVYRMDQLEKNLQKLQVDLGKPKAESWNKAEVEPNQEPWGLGFSESETDQNPGLLCALKVAHFGLNFQGDDPFVSHIFHIKEKFQCFLNTLRKKLVADWEDEIEKFASEILNAVDLFDDYFWGCSLENCQEVSSKIPHSLLDDSREIRASLIEFLKAGKIEETYYPYGSQLDSEQQYFILPETHTGKQEMKIDLTLRPGFIKINAHGDFLNLRKSIVRIL